VRIPSEAAQVYRFDGARHSEMMAPPVERTRYARAVAGLLAASHLESFDNGVSKALILGFDGSAM